MKIKRNACIILQLIIVLVCVFSLHTLAFATSKSNVYSVFAHAWDAFDEVPSFKMISSRNKGILNALKLEGNNVKKPYIFTFDCEKSKMTIKTFEAKLTEGFKDVGSDDIAVFYLSTHGFETNKDQFVLATTSKGCRVYDYKDLALALNNLPCKKIIIILDICYAGRFIGQLKKTVGKKDLSRFSVFASADKSHKAGCSGMTNSSPAGQLLSEIGVMAVDKMYSHYTITLCNSFAVEDGVMKADRNSDGKLTEKEATDYAVGHAAEFSYYRQKHSESVKKQKPQYYAGKSPLLKYGKVKKVEVKNGYKKKITVGQKTKLCAVVSPENVKVTWTSSNKEVASVSSKGVVIGKKPGKVKIFASFNGVKKGIKITVKKAVNTSTKKITKKYQSLTQVGLIGDNSIFSGQKYRILSVKDNTVKYCKIKVVSSGYGVSPKCEKTETAKLTDSTQYYLGDVPRFNSFYNVHYEKKKWIYEVNQADFIKNMRPNEWWDMIIFDHGKVSKLFTRMQLAS